jgi:hypothetical protein
MIETCSAALGQAAPTKPCHLPAHVASSSPPLCAVQDETTGPDSNTGSLPQGLSCTIEPSSRPASAVMRNMMATVEEEGGEGGGGAIPSQQSSLQLNTQTQEGASHHPILSYAATTADTASVVSPCYAFNAQPGNSAANCRLRPCNSICQQHR